ncbi:P-loop NTPase fold protein [Erwiniaceae bacterium L1_54_3]|nr:P-loop NTPase fold protein [Erwiniaceae bacterium L1_54_3]
MAIHDTRQALEKLILNDDVNVITISGVWGSGKTYLWDKLKDESQNEKIKNARYVSLYGLNDIKSVKEGLLRNMLGHDKHGNNIRRKLGNVTGYVKNVTSQFVKGVPAVLDFSDVALPFYLKDAIVVIDDIERLDKDLSLRQLMGFINEYVTQCQTRFLLIMNNERMTEENKNNWREMNEKIVDYELSHTITPEEAFDIGSAGHQLDYRDDLLKAIDTLNINNIRVIKKIINLCALILPSQSNLMPGALSRVIPSIVLTVAVYYKIVDWWGDINDYVTFMEKVNYISTFGHLPKKSTEKEKEAYSVIEGLGIIYVEGLISSIIIIIESALTKDAGVHDVIKSISDKEAELLAQKKYFSFHSNYYWDFNKSNEILLQEAKELFEDIRYLSPRDMAGLLDFMEKENVFANLVDKFQSEWTQHNVNKGKIFREEDLLTPDGEKIRDDIYSQVIIEPKAIVPHSGVKEALRNITENHSWGERQAAVFRSATVSSIKDEIYGMSGNELRTFIGDVAFISKPGMADTPGFSGIAYKLRQAADAIIAEKRNPRLCTVLSERLVRFVPSQNAAETGDDLKPETH